jgi:predicted MFS family arabinose efflux permease
LGSLGAGLAPTLPVLLACRSLQGLGGALLSPASLALLTGSSRAGAEREHAIAIWSVTASVGAAASALFGGVLTQTLGWRWVLLINVFLAPLLLAGSRGVAVRARGDRGRARELDVAGAVLFLLAFGGADLAATIGGGDQLVRSLSAGGVAIASLLVLVFVERRVRHPLLPLGLLRLPQVAYTNGAAVLLLAGNAASGFYLTQYAQDVAGLTPLQTALCLLPTAAFGMGTARAVPALISRLGDRRCRTLGPSLSGLGQLALALGLHAHLAFPALIPFMVLSSVGSSIAVVTLTSAATRSLPAHQAGLAGGLISTAGQSGSSVGLAVLTGVAAAITMTAGATTTAARATAIPPQAAIALSLGALLSFGAAVLANRIPSTQAPRPRTSTRADASR